MKIAVTGGAGFIGSAFVRLALAGPGDIHIANVDALTYAGNLENLAAVSADPRYSFHKTDIADPAAIEAVFAEVQPDAGVHFAAESHVDRSILSPEPVIRTNLNGTFNLLEAARRHKIARFVHVSTDKVYGSIDEPHEADENYPLRASNPYSASKAGSDLLALSYCTTYKMNVSVTRASNNYGPFQFPEKLIPLMIANALEGKLVSAMTAPNSPIERAVVVDDGSGPEFAKLFQRVEQLRNVRLLHHAINLGKGAALKTGINFALTNWPTTTGVITADADGQHSPADIVAVARELKRYPQALILGARRFGGPVPLRSWLRNTLTRQIFRVATEKSFTDTQTGLRGWPRSACLYKHFGDDSTLRVAA